MGLLITAMKFSASKFETQLILKIAKRAVAMAKANDIEHDHMSAIMDIEACHCNGTPLDLGKLLAADDGTFGHDVFGIRRFIDRSTGKIGGCFVPRCAMHEALAA